MAEEPSEETEVAASASDAPDDRSVDRGTDDGPADAATDRGLTATPDAQTEPKQTTEPPAPTGEIIALLSGYESGVPTREQLMATTDDSEGVLVALSRDATQPPVVRQAATRALGVVGGDHATGRLLDLMSETSGDAGLRRAAVQGAAPLVDDEPDLLAAVQTQLHDPVPAVARAAVFALADIASARSHLETLDGEAVPIQVKTALDEILRGGTEVEPPTATRLEPSRTRTRGRR